jgi:MOSC domain-containing protein YiiM
MKHTNITNLTDKITALPTPRQDIGTVRALVVRPERGTRQLVDSMRLTPEGGIDGDRWGKVKQSSRRRQVSMIRSDILELFSGGDTPEISGDNIHVDFDLSHEHLPAGSEIIIGGVTLRVSGMKHLPCEQFIERFGEDAYSVAKSAQMLNIRARGVLLEVVVGGTIAKNDKLRVHHRA